MKKIIVAMVLALVLLGCDGGLPDIQNNPLIQPTAEYEIDTWGANTEVYEFTPITNPTYTCVFVMLDDGSDMGLQCFPKPESIK